MASNNLYTNKNINRENIIPALMEAGFQDVKIIFTGKPNQIQLRSDGVNFKFAAYYNTSGSTTLSGLQGQDKELFIKVADTIINHCSYSDKPSIEISLPRFSAKNLTDFLDFLKESGEETSVDKTAAYEIHRFKSRQGETLTVKAYGNGTLQLQGKFGALASDALDFLGNVLSYKDAIALQIDGFKINVSVNDILLEVEGKLPRSFHNVEEALRKQLAASLTLSKIIIALPDYGSVAFGALRGLEGFLKVELVRAGFDLSQFRDFGEYFELAHQGKFVMREAQKQHAGDAIAAKLADSYTVFNRHRHGIVHMTHEPQTSRVLETLDDAKSIIGEVFGTMESFHS